MPVASSRTCRRSSIPVYETGHSCQVAEAVAVPPRAATVAHDSHEVHTIDVEHGAGDVVYVNTRLERQGQVGQIGLGWSKAICDFSITLTPTLRQMLSPSALGCILGCVVPQSAHVPPNGAVSEHPARKQRHSGNCPRTRMSGTASCPFAGQPPSGAV